MMTELLSTLSEELVKTVEAVGAGVVRVEARRRLPASGIVWSPDGVVVTASHVVERDDDIRVGLPDGRAVPARLAGRDPGTDLAVVRAGVNHLTPPAWADPDQLRVGTLALALGRPGQKVLATLGILSALDDAWRTPAGGQVDRYLQTDAAMYPGFSGGPLVDIEQRLIGLNTSALVQGHSLSIPATTVRHTVETLLTHGRVRRGWLGIGAQAVRLSERARRQAGQDTGLLLMMVDPRGPAERGGLFIGDILIALDGQPVHDMDDLLALLGNGRVGQTVPVRLVRGGEVREARVTIGERGA
jgi:S1-C subfamily serine protease